MKMTHGTGWSAVSCQISRRHQPAGENRLKEHPGVGHGLLRRVPLFRQERPPCAAPTPGRAISCGWPGARAGGPDGTAAPSRRP